MNPARRLVLAGVTSGVGKTTLTCALLAAFRRRGLRVQPFKAGPDYIDPSHHTRAAGVPSRNLDSVLLSAETMRALFARAAGVADISLVEGVMGLFDGRNGRDEQGSTAQIAKLLDAPVVVVIDVAKTSRTAGAIALGCLHFDPRLCVAGFILNRVGSETHARWASEAVADATGLPVFGAFPRMPDLTLPERHLGLVPTGEFSPDDTFFERLAIAAEEHLAVDDLWAAAEDRALTISADGLLPTDPRTRRANIAVARDAAFNFYYEDSLDLLRAWGAELLPFSPLVDSALPEGTQGVYLGGGFPELFAEQLTANTPMHEALRHAVLSGIPVYGECGGLMYLGRMLTDFNGRDHTMVGAIPFDSRMQRRRATLGYRTATALQSNLLLDRGAQVIGHEFHYSELTCDVPEGVAAYRLRERGDAPEGYSSANLLASYVHLHFGSQPDLSRRFVDSCSRGGRS